MSKIAELVSEAIALDRRIVELEEKKKLVTAKLIDHAKLDEDAHVATEKGGWSWTAKDDEGNIARVTVAGRSLKEGIDLESEITEKVRSLVPKETFGKLFVNATYYKLVEKFRERAVELLDKTVANKLIKLVTSKGKTSVSFETKEAA